MTVYLVIIPNGIILAAYSTNPLAEEHARAALGARVLALEVRDCLPESLNVGDDSSTTTTNPETPRSKAKSKPPRDP